MQPQISYGNRDSQHIVKPAGGVVPVGGGRWWGKGVGGWIRCKKCVHMYVNAKMILVETTPGIRWGDLKENIWGGEFMYDIFDTL
jgi:hypothetical protein